MLPLASGEGDGLDALGARVLLSPPHGRIRRAVAEKCTHTNCFADPMAPTKPSPGRPLTDFTGATAGRWTVRGQSSSTNTALAGVSQDPSRWEHHEALPRGLALLARPKKLQETSQHPTARLSVRRGWSPRQSTAVTQIPGLTFSAMWLCP